MQFAVVFSCLVLSVSHLQEHVRAVVPCLNNEIQCGLNATCVNNRCQCPGNLTGNPRVYCDSDRCICTGRADTIYNLFDLYANPLSIKVNLPCSVDLVRPPLSGRFLLVGGCSINYITANSFVRPGRDASGPAFRTFIQSLELSALVRPFFFITLNLTSEGATFSAPVGAVENDIPKQGAPAAQTFRAVNLTPCNLRLGLRELYGEAYVSLARGVDPSTLRGLCGNCNNLTDIESSLDTASGQLDYYFQNLAPAERQRGVFTVQCRNIVNVVQGPGCTYLERGNAARICIRLLQTFGRCLLTNGILSDQALMSAFDVCVSSACSGRSTAALCSGLALQTNASCPLGPCPV